MVYLCSSWNFISTQYLHLQGGPKKGGFKGKMALTSCKLIRKGRVCPTFSKLKKK